MSLHRLSAWILGLSLCAAPPAAYMGQTPPGAKAVVFAPDVISTGRDFVMNGAFSRDGRSFYYTVTDGPWMKFDVWMTRLEGRTWTPPAPAKLLPGKDTFEVFFAPDGQRMLFTGGTMENTDLYLVTQAGAGWGVPVRLPDVINSPVYEMFSSMTREGTLYFGRNGEVWRSRLEDGQYRRAEPLPAPVNTGARKAGDPLISPDEDFLIFLMGDGPDSQGQADLYISFRTKDGGWTAPRNLGQEINTPEFECGPSLTPDGKYLLFTRRKAWKTDVPSKIWWVSTDFIQRLRPL